LTDTFFPQVSLPSSDLSQSTSLNTIPDANVLPSLPTTTFTGMLSAFQQF